jgi:hypothetical protein
MVARDALERISGLTEDMACRIAVRDAALGGKPGGEGLFTNPAT